MPGRKGHMHMHMHVAISISNLSETLIKVHMQVAPFDRLWTVAKTNMKSPSPCCDRLEVES